MARLKVNKAKILEALRANLKELPKPKDQSEAFEQWRTTQVQMNLDHISQYERQVLELRERVGKLQALRLEDEETKRLGFGSNAPYDENRYHNNQVQFFINQIEFLEGDAISIDEQSAIWHYVKGESK